MSAALALINISKSYGSEAVLRDLSLSLEPGSVTLLLGANGSGKSTLLKIAAGLLRPAKGSATIFGRKPSDASVDFGFAGHHPMLYSDLTVAENLRLHGTMRSCAIDINVLADNWGLRTHLHKKLSALSKGLQARASLARALLHSPRLLLLDEPTAALDEQGVEILKERLREDGAGRTVLLATHDLARLSAMATRAVVVAQGKISAESDQLSSGVGGIIDYYRKANR